VKLSSLPRPPSRSSFTIVLLTIVSLDYGSN
jgi:hypothetical protein